MYDSPTETEFITNREVARILFQTAALLETMECNPYRVRAYRRAALGVLFLPKQLADYFAADEPAPLPGVGERMRRHLADLVNTGHMDSHEALLDEVGEPMLSLLSVPGVGPRTAVRLVSELEIDSLEDLASAVDQQRIRELHGFGPKREAQLASALEARLGPAA